VRGVRGHLLDAWRGASGDFVLLPTLVTLFMLVLLTLLLLLLGEEVRESARARGDLVALAPAAALAVAWRIRADGWDPTDI
jgi:hypothetical protein